MGHHVQAIIVPMASADAISQAWPELPRANLNGGFVAFPVDADLIDNRIAPDVTPGTADNQLILLTNGFHEQLRILSCQSQLAYVETDYFGGVGGQGALVMRDGKEIMPPTWRTSGAINDALALIGVRRKLMRDEFDTVGLGDIRSNDDLVEMIDDQRNRPAS